MLASVETMATHCPGALSTPRSVKFVAAYLRYFIVGARFERLIAYDSGHPPTWIELDSSAKKKPVGRRLVLFAGAKTHGIFDMAMMHANASQRQTKKRSGLRLVLLRNLT
jgi:hypothetical protein